MAVTIVDTSQTLSDYRQRVALDGVTFEMRFRFNSRIQSWFVDIYDEDGAILVYGRRCTIGWALLRQNRHIDGIPAGDLICIDTANRGEPPGENDFGTRALMTYLDGSELTAIDG